MIRFLTLCVLTSLASPGLGLAADPTYWKDIRPIFRRNCTVCHKESKIGEKDVSAGLALDSYAILRKSASKAVLVPGKPDESLLIQLLTTKNLDRRMPLDTDPLPADTVALLAKWVSLGCPEGTKMEEPAPSTTTTVSRPVHRLPVTFSTKLAIPTQRGAVDFTLPIGPLSPVAAVAFHPDGKLLATGSYGRVTLWDLTQARPIRVLTQVLGSVNDLQFSPDGSLLAVAGGQPSARGDLRLFETGSGKQLHSLGGHLDTVSGIRFSPDGSKLLSASFDKTVRLWDVKTAKVLHTFTGHSDSVYMVAFSPDGKWYATASKDRTCRIVDTSTGTSRFTFNGNDKEVIAVAVSPDGKQVITSGLDPAFSWWDMETGARESRKGGHSVATFEAAYTRKGDLVVSCGADKTVRTLNPATGAVVRSIAHDSIVFSVVVDRAGKRLASGSADGLTRVWDAASGRLLVTLWSGPGEGELGGWLAETPEGYFAADAVTSSKMAWRVAGKPLTDAKPLAVVNNPKFVAQAAEGATVPAAIVK